MPSSHPVFFDHSGGRWKRLMRLATGAALLLSMVGAAFSFSVAVLPLSPLKVTDPADVRQFVPKLESKDVAARRFLAAKSREKLNKIVELESSKIHPRSPGSTYSTVVGFYVNWDPASFESLRAHIDSLTYVMPQWLVLGKDGKSFSSRWSRLTDDPKLAPLAAAHQVPVIPMLDNYDRAFDWQRLKLLLLADDASQRKLADDLCSFLLKHHYKGINLDLEPPTIDSLPTAERGQAARLLRDGLPHFVGILHDIFKAHNLLVTQDLPAQNDSLDYDRLNDVNDFVIIMLYDQHTPDGDVGPIAGQNWVEKVAENIFSRMDSKKVVLGVGNYCYDWPVIFDSNGHPRTAGKGAGIQLADALRYAKEAQAQLQMDDGDLNPHFPYVDKSGRDHLVYLTDAVTAYNLIVALKGYEPLGAALWYLGPEDPTIWSFFGEGRLGKPVRPAQLQRVVYNSNSDIVQKGQGELMEVVGRPAAGFRRFEKDSDGLIVSETFHKYPAPHVIRHYGQVDGCVALTFDDGPDPDYTPRILDILKRNDVHATFFVVGSNADASPGIVTRCWAEGNEIGNHTYTHPHISEVSPLRARLELNATERNIESLIGRSTRLFRPPFGVGADTNPLTAQEAEMMLRAQRLGYITVGMNVDPNDYERPGVQKIVNRVLGDLGVDPSDHPRPGVAKDLVKGNVILLHDGGGDRDQTIAALPTIIRKLKAHGYRFVTVSQLMGPGGRDAMFPAVTRGAGEIDGFDRVVFESGFMASRALGVLFLVAIFLGVSRMLVITPLAIIQSRRSCRAVRDGSYAPPVTVIVPAFNEDKVICRTIHTVLASDYPDLRVVVVDDGSTDDTTAIVRETFADEPRLKFIRKENGGKATALNLGIEQVNTELIVAVDADTVLAPDAIRRLVCHFHDPKVGAVAGNVKVGNRINALTIWQSVEYITSQNFERRAYAALDSVPVVPGAIGAWRTSAILQAGGYVSDTLAEDADLTFRIRLLGYRILAENSALAFTEAPETVSALAKQRFRWAFGILQSLWKHKSLLFRARYGAFSMLVMPMMWVYNIGLQVFSPLVDLVMLLALLSGQFWTVATYYAAFFVLDFFASLVAFLLDKESLGQLKWLFWQRFFYRQFMYYVLLRSLLAALRGGLVGWGKLQRKATALNTGSADPPTSA